MLAGIGDSSRLTDTVIRRAIHLQLIPQIVGETESRILDEMPVCCGDARIDIAVINGHLHGFEIKSESDTLERLSGQAMAYNRVFDTVTIICGRNHIGQVISQIPSWWGIYSAKVHLGRIELTRMRCAEMNSGVEKISLAQLLWKSELTELLSDAGIKKGVSGKPCRTLWGMVSDTFSTSDLRYRVREILKLRDSWRLPLPQK